MNSGGSHRSVRRHFPRIGRTGGRHAKGEVMIMRQAYSDLYVLFRHNSRAQELFDRLPAHVQDQVTAAWRQIDSMDRLERFAARYHAPLFPLEVVGGQTFLPPPAQL